MTTTKDKVSDKNSDEDTISVGTQRRPAAAAAAAAATTIAKGAGANKGAVGTGAGTTRVTTRGNGFGQQSQQSQSQTPPWFIRAYPFLTVVFASVALHTKAVYGAPLLGVEAFSILKDTILASPPRILALSNLYLFLTCQMHNGLAHHYFLTLPNTNPDNATVSFSTLLPKYVYGVVGKLLVISAVLAPDTVDLLWLFGWFTALGCLQSLVKLVATAQPQTQTQKQSPTQNGTLHLLVVVLVLDMMAMAGLLYFGLVHLFNNNDDDDNEQQQQQQEAATSSIPTRADTITPAGISTLLILLCGDPISLVYHTLAHMVHCLLLFDHQGGTIGPDQTRSRIVCHATEVSLQIMAHAVTMVHILYVWYYLHGLQGTVLDGLIGYQLMVAVNDARVNIHWKPQHLKVKESPTTPCTN